MCRFVSLASLSLSLSVAVACGGDSPGSVDAGSVDAGPVVDSGSVDAGAGIDGSPADSGADQADGGANGDAGTAQLGPGSLHFIGVNSDIPEGFALVPLVDVPSGTQLRFTERAWNATSQAFEIPEGTATLTLTQDVSAGTVFEVTVSGPSTLSVSPAIGTIADDGTGNWGIAGNGDNLFVYVGMDSAPTFIAGIAFSAPLVWTTVDTGLDGQSSMIPASLSELDGTITTFSADNLRYNGLRTGQGSFSAYLPLIADEASYETGTAAYSPLRGTDFSP